MRRVTKEGVTFSEDIPLSPEVKKLIKDMLRYDPTDRITLGFITHTPWVTQSKISEQATYRALNPQEAMEETPQEDSDSLFSDDLSLGDDDNSNEEVSQVDTIQPAPFGSPLRGKDSKKNSIQASTPQHFRKGSDLISRPDMIQKTSRM